ncbi:MAG: DUF1653 domain-containing protein [Leifsonia sp.]|nr:DUF1653 domain-containing protein [Leifsonia sp.]
MEVGWYRHYRGGLYRVIGVATHTESSEQLVVYESSDGELFVRPIEMFAGIVEAPSGELAQRFTLTNSPADQDG